jgi:predicted dehydrogenase
MDDIGMKFLIAGFGSIGRRHFRNLKALGENDFVFFRTRQSTLPEEEIAAYPVETNLASALDHEPDVVIVSNPTALHLDVAIPAAMRGCHLFLEKPISHSMERVDRLEKAVARGGGLVLVGFQFRYHPQLITIKSLLQVGAIGQPTSVRAQWGEYLPDWHPWEDYRQGYSARKDLGGGVVLTLSHPLDYLHWLIGEVSQVWAFTRKVESLQIEVDAVAEIGLSFKNGVIGSLHLDYIQRPNAHQLEIVGTRGKIQWDYMEGSLRIYRASSDITEAQPLPGGYKRNDMFQDQMAHLLAVVREGERPRCSLAEGIMAQKLAMAVHTSAQTEAIVKI